MKTLLLATDAELVHEFRAGNNQALEVLINRHKEKIFSSILFFIKDKYYAEDIFQDAFIKIIDTIKDSSYAEEGKFLSYAIRIAHNVSVDYLRKVKRAPVINMIDDDNLEIFTTTASAADKNIIELQTSNRIKQLLDKLPKDQREVIILRHFADLSFKEIAEMTNCGINTALGRMRYGLTNLRAMLTEKQIAL